MQYHSNQKRFFTHPAPVLTEYDGRPEPDTTGVRTNVCTGRRMRRSSKESVVDRLGGNFAGGIFGRPPPPTRLRLRPGHTYNVRSSIVEMRPLRDGDNQPTYESHFS